MPSTSGLAAHAVARMPPHHPVPMMPTLIGLIIAFPFLLALAASRSAPLEKKSGQRSILHCEVIFLLQTAYHHDGLGSAPRR
jgi:hypothetical protein